MQIGIVMESNQQQICDECGFAVPSSKSECPDCGRSMRSLRKNRKRKKKQSEEHGVDVLDRSMDARLEIGFSMLNWD